VRWQADTLEIIPLVRKRCIKYSFAEFTLDSEKEIIGLSQRLVALRITLFKEMGSSANSFLAKYPIENAVELVFAQRPIRNYDSLSDKLADQFKAMESAADGLINSNYKKLMLIELMLVSLSRLPNRLPLAIRSRYLRNFERIYLKCCADPELSKEFADYKDDGFLKNLGICSMFILPLGAQKVNKNSLPLYWIKEISAEEKINFFGKYIFKYRGRSPFYDMHTDSQDKELLEDFNETGWREFLLELADLMLLDPDVLGAYGIGWFFDPKVWEVSPRLSYLGDIIKESSGYVFRAGENQNAAESALATSPTRRSLYEQKLYVPCNYIAIWDRASLLKWHSRL
jgi:hypothetical protein